MVLSMDTKKLHDCFFQNLLSLVFWQPRLLENSSSIKFLEILDKKYPPKYMAKIVRGLPGARFKEHVKNQGGKCELTVGRPWEETKKLQELDIHAVRLPYVSRS
jgi:hypothetical protein